MNMAIRIHRHGGPEEMIWEEAGIIDPPEGHVQVRHTAIGVNYSDVNVRRGGFYPNHHPAFPMTLGNEASGIVERLGPGVKEFTPGARVAYAGTIGQFYENSGAYCQVRNVPAGRLVPIPDAISDEQAAAILLKGSTASLIINRLYTPKAGETVLVHTAASGVGSLLCQWAKHLGATVIGTAGSQRKTEVGLANGCDHVIPYRSVDFVEAVRNLVPEGIDAVYDGVGQDTFFPSLALLRPYGKAVNYGNASGNVPPFNILALAIKSLSVARAGVTGHIEDTDSLRSVAGELFDLIAQGALHAMIDKRYSLREAKQAHLDIENAAHAGSVLLIP